jgi:hypothetical protein
MFDCPSHRNADMIAVIGKSIVLQHVSHISSLNNPPDLHIRYVRLGSRSARRVTASTFLTLKELAPLQ